MGRNLWIEDTTFSRAFTILVWDDFFNAFPPPPDPLTGPSLSGWAKQIRELSSVGPVLYEIWRKRAGGTEESCVAYAVQGDRKLRFEGVYDEFSIREVDEFPTLWYRPPEWKGLERFDEVFQDAGLYLQSAPLAEFFSEDLERLREFSGCDRVLDFGII